MNLLNNRLLKTELVEWKKLIPFQPDNLKKTEPHKLQKLANSLCENGFSMNFYVWEKEGQIYIIDGHSRQEVLQLLESGAIFPRDSSGKEYQVTIPDKFPCSFLHLKNKSEAKKAVLIYNSKYKSIDSDILSEWVSDLSLDELKSQIEIPELKLDFDLPQELEGDSIDDAAKIQTNIKLGDLIEIGKHRLLCGDSTKKEDVEKLMNGAKCDIIFTSPPYNGDITITKSRLKKGEKFDKSMYANSEMDNKSDKDYVEFNKLIFDRIKEISTNETVILYNISYNRKSPGLYIEVVKEGMAIFNLVETIIWKKQLALSLQGDNLTRIIEFIFVFYAGNGKPKMNKSISECIKNIWEISNIGANEDSHKACFPVGLPSEGLRIYAKEKANVYEPFCGSGSTMVACQTLDRICYGMELEPIYCQVIINRMRKNFPELEIKVNGQIYTE